MYDIEILLHINRIFKDYNLEKEVINFIKLYIFSNRLSKNIICNHYKNWTKSIHINSKELYISKRLTRNINKLPYDIIFILNYDGDKYYKTIKELGKQGRMNSLMLNYEKKNEYYELILKLTTNFQKHVMYCFSYFIYRHSLGNNCEFNCSAPYYERVWISINAKQIPEGLVHVK